MAVDRNVRARLGARIRADRRLSPTARLVGQAALFSAMDARTGRCQAYRARLAHEAGCSPRSVTRATTALQEAGYIRVVATWGQRRRENGGRWFRPQGANVIEWVLPAGFLVDRMARYPSPLSKNLPPAPLSEGLSRVLERLGTAIADQYGLSRTPQTA